ncbi:peptidyl serine alpha-galactosyltransferase isoform X1 [Selaginella moellendorffii]|nr:peptidyl serine alpha-galactosyltransferase isoform X1 [Selaginella moellendorffii]|eukprot:XP_002970675.2 peptidyl serine alpha-galactosyltransferase isoform X1 [Selaginella moellendorffii]
MRAPGGSDWQWRREIMGCLAVAFLLCSILALAAADPAPGRRIHTLFSVECNNYFDWQTVGLMHSFRISGHVGPITRLLSCTDEQLGSYGGMDLAPTHVVPSMSKHPVTGDWYPAINKPAGVVHWLNHSEDAKKVDWVVILDADMIIRKPLLPWDLGAEKGKPVSASYGYLIGCDNILAQLHTAHPEFCDKVGGLIAMHIDDLRAMAPLWLSKTEEVRQDKEHWATNITGDIYSSGWISEMYGYSFGAAEVGLRHKINDDVMLYPGYTPRAGVEPSLLHYGLGFKVGNWSFGKASHRDDNIVYDCNRLFPAPPHPDVVRGMNANEDEARGFLLSVECINTINAGLVLHHEKRACPKPKSDYVSFLNYLLKPSAHSKKASETVNAEQQEPRPYPKIHTLFSAECSAYFDWQTVGLVHSFKLSGQPGYITRLLSCSEKDLKSYKGMDLAPTHLVPSMSVHPLTGDWYPAINKPAAVLHWLHHVVTDVDFLVILDADMIMRGPITPWEFNAERGHPVSAPYNYLIGCDNELAQLHTRHPEACDKVGGVIIMHIEDVRALAPLWLFKTEEVRADKAHWATNITGDQYAHGWISEMYGYSFGAAEIELRHRIRDDIMLYPGYVPQEGSEPRVLHYGLEFSVGDWKFDKADWRNENMTSKCWRKFPEPPDPSTLTTSDRGERRRDEISIECISTINQALDIHHRKHGCVAAATTTTTTTAANSSIAFGSRGEAKQGSEEAVVVEKSVDREALNSFMASNRRRSVLERFKRLPVISLSPRYWMIALWTLLVSCFLLVISAIYSRQRNHHENGGTKKISRRRNKLLAEEESNGSSQSLDQP